MNPIESFFLGCGFSWTMSKLLPYTVAVLLGWFIIFLFRRKLGKRLWLRITVYLAGMAAFFFAYFAFWPIYAGDFSNNSRMIKAEGELRVKQQKFVVITIPGCPFCEESISRMKDFKAHNPDVKLEYVVCPTNGESGAASIEYYNELADGRFEVKLAKNGSYMADAAGHGFPAYVLTEGKMAKTWSNDSFGVMALDEVAAAFEK